MLHAIAAFLRREGETLERAPAHEMLRVGLCLAFTGGFLDAYTYLLRGGVFANAQTGNMVLMALYAARRDGRAFYYLLPIAAFLAGVIVTEWLKARLTNAQHIAWQHVVLLAEAILVFAVGFVPRERAGRCGECDGFVHLLSAGEQFRRTRGLPYATTMCTGNLRSAGEHVFAWAHGDKTAGRAALRYCAVILVFCAGAWAGAVLAGALGRTRRVGVQRRAAGGFRADAGGKMTKAENRKARRLYPAERFTPPGGIQARACFHVVRKTRKNAAVLTA